MAFIRGIRKNTTDSQASWGAGKRLTFPWRGWGIFWRCRPRAERRSARGSDAWQSRTRSWRSSWCSRRTWWTWQRNSCHWSSRCTSSPLQTSLYRYTKLRIVIRWRWISIQLMPKRRIVRQFLGPLRTSTSSSSEKILKNDASLKYVPLNMC